jgi:hypothetical protein
MIDIFQYFNSNLTGIIELAAGIFFFIFICIFGSKFEQYKMRKMQERLTSSLKNK